MRRFIIAGAFILAAGSAAHADVVLTKSPDLGPYWHPVSDHSTYVYTNSFVAPVTGTVTSLGTWLVTASAGTAPSTIVFEVFGNASGAPDPTSVLAQTNALAFTLDTLTFESAAPTSSVVLTAGETYWFAISAVGQNGGDSEYQVGGHTQNSEGIVDNGTFWYSNDPSGLNFGGSYNVPEMAFSVTLSGSAAIPEPVSLAILGTGLGGLALTRRRRS